MVATPIGNLGDLTFRALEVLKSSDRILCEDPRQTLKLLSHYGIQKPLFTVSGPRERRDSDKVLQYLAQGQNLALVTDAGTPGVSDPGAWLADAARRGGFDVVPIPGVSAVACAVSVAGYLENGFVYLGFLHRKKGKLKKELVGASSGSRAVLFFESPHRIIKTLEAAQEALGNAVVCWIGREMTKKFEEYYEGPLADVIEKLKRGKVMGEFTVILKPVGSAQ